MELVNDKRSSFTFDGVTKTCSTRCYRITVHIKDHINLRVVVKLQTLRHTLVVMGRRSDAAETRKTICM